MVWIMRFILLALIAFFVHLFINSTLTPNRKLRQAIKQKRFYMLDDKKNIQKNFLLTFKGAVFEGEKYPGTEKNSFEVVSISLWMREPAELEGMGRQDFFFIEKKILKQYPKAKINWHNPFYELMR